MKKAILFFVFVTGISLSFAQNSAPSLHLTSRESSKGDIIMKTVRATITARSTYFCTMQWNGGQEGGAYCGFQDISNDRHAFIFSIWDPSNRQPIKAHYTGDGTIASRFGGEGTGLKSINSKIGWDLNEWNTVVSRRWNVGQSTYYGFWVRRGSQDKWHHMITMNYPIKDVYFNNNTNSFLEDWSSTGQNKRKFEMKDGFKRSTNGTWLPFNRFGYANNVEPRSSNYTNANDGGVTANGVFYMQSGGDTRPTYGNNKTFTAETKAEPDNPIIEFSISSATATKIEWDVPTSSTPQFNYTIKIDGAIVTSANEAEVKSATIPDATGKTIEVILEDILGRTASKTIKLDGDDTDPVDEITVDGGEVTTTTNETELTVVTNDGAADNVRFTNSSDSSDKYIYLITDDKGNILTTENNSHDFEGSPAGICLVYGLSYTGSLSVNGKNVADANLTSGDFELSSNFINIIRIDEDDTEPVDPDPIDPDDNDNDEAPTGYCDANGQNTAEEFISRVRLGSIDNETKGTRVGYANYTTMSTTLAKGSSNTIRITPTFMDKSYDEGYAVWIDYNRDGDFEDAGEQVFTSAPSQSTSISGSFTVPSTAKAGTTRMRVSMRFENAPSPCGPYNYGEVEDYTIVIQ